MEDKESTESGSFGGNSASQSPPPVTGGGGVVPRVMNMAVNMSMEGSLAGSTGVGGGGIMGSGGGGSGSGDLTGKKKRGRPRKYDADRNLRLPNMASGSRQVSPPPGFSLSSPSSELGSKRGRGRPPGSGNWQLLASLGELFANTAGGDFTPHVVTVHTGEDVAAKIFSFAQKGPRGICILSANGAVSNVTIRQPGSYGGILTYEGRFEILSLTGSFTISENGGIKSRTGGLSVSLAGPDGRVIGGGIAGQLMAASPIQIVVGSFMPNGFKAHKRKHQHEYTMAPLVHGAPDTVTVATPISQAAPDSSSFPNLGSQLPGQCLGEEDDSNSNKENPNPTSVVRNGSEPISDPRPSPDINVPLAFE
ncbi:unnamed protein product [Ilex paraguariensis]|uniref:AT-hook motif nuclear-localized protein n=1 Tax=Ilex paraguariensis TaxID=185542 RepID=A0ABC8SXB5_9AQUA